MKHNDFIPSIPLTLPYSLSQRRVFMLMAGELLLIYLLLALAALTPLPDSGIALCLILSVIFMYGLLFFPLCYRLELHRDGIRIRFLGKELQWLPFSRIRCICVSSNVRGYQLALSVHTEAELAALWERKLSRGVFTKHEAACRKLGGSWQRSFARDYLLSPQWRLRQCHTGPEILGFPFRDAVLLYLRQNCPDAAFLDLREQGSWRFSPIKADDVPYTDPAFGWKAEIAADGIRYRKKQFQKHFLPGSQIRTLLRVERFAKNIKLEPAHRSYLIASPLDLAQLAEKAAQVPAGRWEKRLIAGLPFRQQLLALVYCNRRLAWQRIPDPEITPLHYTPENETLLRQYFPQAQWVDLSDLFRETLPDAYKGGSF